VAIEVVHLDQQVDGAPVARQDKLKIVVPTPRLGIVGNQLHKVGIVKWEASLPVGELVGVDHGDDVAHALRCSSRHSSSIAFGISNKFGNRIIAVRKSRRWLRSLFLLWPFRKLRLGERQSLLDFVSLFDEPFH
jgi:hypothetical protein